MGNTVYVSLFNKICERQRVCVRLGLSARVFGFSFWWWAWDVGCVCVCVCVCVRRSKTVYDKYSVFISMSGGVSWGQGDRFLLIGRRRMESNNTPLGPSALDSRNHKQHPAHKPPSALSQYLFALIRRTQNVIVQHTGYVCLLGCLPS